MNIKTEIAEQLKRAAAKFGFKAKEVAVEPTVNPQFGDFSSNLALQLTSEAKTIGFDIEKKLSEQVKRSASKIQQTPSKIANQLVLALREQLVAEQKADYFEKIEVAEPGFINFYLSRKFLQAEIGQILKKEENYAKNNLGKGQTARVEFVSANPTGPLHIGNARGGPLGDTICNILTYSGYRVWREFFVNDTGGQVEKFGQTLAWLALGSPFFSKKLAGRTDETTELAYKGKYMLPLAKEVIKKILKEYSWQQLEAMDFAKLTEIFAKIGTTIQLESMISDLEKMGIVYDKLYFESDFTDHKTPQIIKELKKRNLVVKREGAEWFAFSESIRFLADRESVLVKSNGELTYFANDIAYHDEKFKDNPALVINVLGAGHHGHVPRMTAAIAALGYNPAKYKVILYQNVALKEAGKRVKMAKREGKFVTAEEVLETVGKDAFRFFMLLHDASTHLDFDPELAKKKTKDNPVYYVQYAHARICSILRKAKSAYRLPSTVNRELFTDDTQLNHPAELALMRSLIKLPLLVEELTKSFAVHRLTYYAIEIADLFHKFYEQCRVLGRDRRSIARLQLTAATGMILRTTLRLLGVAAPEKM